MSGAAVSIAVTIGAIFGFMLGGFLGYGLGLVDGERKRGDHHD